MLPVGIESKMAVSNTEKKDAKLRVKVCKNVSFWEGRRANTLFGSHSFQLLQNRNEKKIETQNLK